MYKIALIEDDLQLRELISDMLRRYDYQTLEIEEFENTVEVLCSEKADVVILDINLPYLDGFEICKRIRKQSNVPIIFLSARSSEMEQVMGIEFGADDYLTKPFSMEVLRVKITACIRRIYGEYTSEKNMVIHGDFILDCANIRMCYGKKECELTKNEFKIVKALTERMNTYVDRETLLKELWDDIDFIDNNTLNVNISRIKNKFSQIGLEDVIHTKRGYGYMLRTHCMEERDE